jgi:hypothetical protein
MSDAPTPQQQYTEEEMEKFWDDVIRNARPPDWILEMYAFWCRTGFVRSADLYRLLGDQTKGVEASEEGMWRHFFGDQEAKGA